MNQTLRLIICAIFSLMAVTVSGQRPILAPEHSIISNERPPPDDSRDEFVTITETRNAAAEVFNGVQRSTRNVSITAKRLVLSANSDPQRLFARVVYDEGSGINADVKELNIYADVLEIERPLRLPQTTVYIYAREVTFRDPDPATPGQARIDTTPLNFLRKADDATAQTDASNGDEGPKGGKIELRTSHIESIPDRIVVTGLVPRPPRHRPPPIVDDGPLVPFSEERTVKRLIMRGGNGQRPGDGMDAIAGGVMKEVDAAIPVDCFRPSTNTHARGTVRPPAGTVFVYLCPSSFEPQTVGTQAFPTPATPAKQSGRPGRGGNGGELTSNLSIGDLADQLAGEPGPLGKLVKGAKGATPSPAYHVRGSTIIDQRSSGAVPGLAAPISLSPAPVKGTFRLLDSSANTWLHPFLLQGVLRYAKRAYLNGNLDLTRATLAPYAIALAQTNIPAELQPALAALRQDVDSLLTRISANLDYFGHPAGWVPLLSLEANLRAFDNEIDASLPLLYLGYVIEKRAEDQRTDEAVLQESLTRQKAEMTASIEQFERTSALVSSLQDRAANIDREIARVQTAIRVREGVLVAQAQIDVNLRSEQPIWKQGLRVLANACKVIPVFQPVLGAIGEGMTIMTNVDVNAPIDTISRLNSLSSSFNTVAFRQSQQQLDSQIALLRRRSATDIPEYMQNLVRVGQSFAPALMSIRDSIQTHQAPKSEVEAELERLKAQTPELGDLVEEVTKLQGQQQAFATALAKAIADLSNASAQISTVVTSMDTLQQKLSGSHASIDHAVVLVAQQMEQQAFDRLLKYHYFTGKAFEYRLLTPNPAQLDLEDITRRIRTMVGPTLAASSDFAPVAVAYRGAIRTVVATAIDSLEKMPPTRSLPLNIGLEDDELNVLNTQRSVTIDLRTKLGLLPEEEDRRIAALTVLTNGLVAIPDVRLPATANLRLIIEHFGESTITRDGHQYSFHVGSAGDQPFRWGARYDLVDSSLAQETLSLSGESLLRQLLATPGTAVPDRGVQFFVEPGADGFITIRRETVPIDLRVRITKLRLSVTVDFFSASADQVTLLVKTSGSDGATIAVDKRDIVGRQDGRGSFQRAYRSGTSVTLRAPAMFGKLHFAGWFDGQGTTLGSRPELSLPDLITSRAVEARYQP